MARTLLCEIVTPERILYSREVEMVIAPAVDGEIGILPLHAPLVTALKAGEIRVKVGDETIWFASDGGYLQVHEDKVIILADRAELASAIDADGARAAKERIDALMKELPPEDSAHAEAIDDLRWFELQIEVAGKLKRQ